MKCLLCGFHTQKLFSAQDRAIASPETFDLRWCGVCDLGRLAGEFTPGQIATFYPIDYYTHTAATPKSERISILERTLIHAAWRRDDGQDFDPAELKAGNTVCDIGCGNGGALRKFKAAGYRTVGIDPDGAAREAAKDAGEIYAGTAEDIPQLGSFDVVLMSHVLEHCIDPSEAVAKAKSILAEKGTLVIEVPNNAALGFRWFGPLWPWTDIPRHLSFFTDRSLSILLERNGLKITKTYYTGYTRQFAPGWRRQVQSSLSGWPLLARSAFSTDRLKYDSIRVHAVNS